MTERDEGLPTWGELAGLMAAVLPSPAERAAEMQVLLRYHREGWVAELRTQTVTLPDSV